MSFETNQNQIYNPLGQNINDLSSSLSLSKVENKEGTSIWTGINDDGNKVEFYDSNSDGVVDRFKEYCEDEDSLFMREIKPYGASQILVDHEYDKDGRETLTLKDKHIDGVYDSLYALDIDDETGEEREISKRIDIDYINNDEEIVDALLDEALFGEYNPILDEYYQEREKYEKLEEEQRRLEEEQRKDKVTQIKDEFGKVTAEHHTTYDNMFPYTDYFEYNDKNLVSRKTQVHEDGGVHVSVYKYDKNDKLQTEYRDMDEDGLIDSAILYDEEGCALHYVSKYSQDENEYKQNGIGQDINEF